MNRRGFLGLVTAAAVAPQELIRAPVPAPVLDAAAAGSAYSRALAQSLLQTKEVIAANVLNRGFMNAAAFRAALTPILNEVFEEEYAKRDTDWGELFEEDVPDREMVGRVRWSDEREISDEFDGEDSEPAWADRRG